MKKILLVSSLFSLSAFSALGQDSFTSEVSAGFIKFDDTKAYSVSGSYFFEPVNTGQGPLAEAVFLNRANSVSASFTRNEFDFSSDTLADLSFNTNTWSVGGVYHFEGTGLFLGASVAHLNGSDAAAYGLSGGYYLSDDWSVTIGTSFDEDLEYTGFGLSTKKLIDLGGDTFLNLGASYNKPDEGDSSYQVSGDYYLNSRLSVGASHAWASEFDEGTSAVNARWFVTDTLSLTGQISDTDVGDDSETGYSVAISARF